MKILSYSISQIAPDRGYAIWAMMEPNNAMPVCYLRKPKWMNDAQWDAVLGAVRFEANSDILDRAMSEGQEAGTGEG